MVFLHGLLSSRHDWDPVRERLDFPSVALDIPGFGDAEDVDNSRLSSFLLPLLGRIASLPYRDIVLVGHSLGGLLASRLCEYDPFARRIKACVLIEPAGFGRLPAAEILARKGALRRLAALTSTLGIASLPVAEMIYMLFVGSPRKPLPLGLWRHIAWGALIHRNGPAAALKVIAREGRKGEKWQAKYLGDVVAVFGTKDHLVPLGHRYNLARAYRKPSSILVWDVHHHPQQECPERVARLVESVATRVQKHRTRRRRLRRPNKTATCPSGYRDNIDRSGVRLAASKKR